MTELTVIESTALAPSPEPSPVALLELQGDTGECFLEEHQLEKLLQQEPFCYCRSRADMFKAMGALAAHHGYRFAIEYNVELDAYLAKWRREQ